MGGTSKKRLMNEDTLLGYQGASSFWVWLFLVASWVGFGLSGWLLFENCIVGVSIL